MSTKRYAFLFPGQGAQEPGMAKDLWDSSEAVREFFARAGDLCGRDIPGLLFEGTEEELAKTDVTQIAMAAADVAADMVCREHGLEPSGAAGFSLGEYPALHAAGVLSTDAMVDIVKIRGELMEAYSREFDDEEGPAGLIAVLGKTLEESRETLEALGEHRAYLANHSAPKQLVVAGSGHGLKKAEQAFSELGARKVVKLKVSGPFHSPLLEDARKEFRKELDRFEFSDPVMPVYANATGTRLSTGSEARDLCGKQIVSTVQWVSCEQGIDDGRYDAVLETGPGTVLSGLWKSYRRGEPACKPAGTIDAIRAAARG
ncbi:MAG: ACP S-malonyltransferase [Spirochaetota bacterium]